jgi:tetratricopeptide (TPR) repeat protein
MNVLISVVLWLAEPTPLTAEELARAAEVHFRAGRYDEASRELERAHALDPKPHLLFGRSVAERHAGRCEIALALLERFLASGPAPPDEAEARREMRACGVESPEPTSSTTAQPSPDEATAPPPVVAAVTDNPVLGPSGGQAEPKWRPDAWYRDPWGGAMVALGLVGIGLGGGFAAQAMNGARGADNAPDADAYLERMRRAQMHEAVSITGFSVGGALVLGGVIRWIVVARRARARGTASHLSLDALGSSVVLRARF